MTLFTAWQVKSVMEVVHLVVLVHMVVLVGTLLVCRLLQIANRSSTSCKRYVTIFFLEGSFADDPEQRWIIIIWPRRAILTVRIMVASLFLRYKTEKGLRAV